MQTVELTEEIRNGHHLLAQAVQCAWNAATLAALRGGVPERLWRDLAAVHSQWRVLTKTWDFTQQVVS